MIPTQSSLRCSPYGKLSLCAHYEFDANPTCREHGELRRTLEGRADFPLSEAGRSQAGRLRSRLEREDYSPTRIYSSPLSRVLETAQIASSIWDLPIESWDDLMEHDVGAFSGFTWEELEERFPETLREFRETLDFDLIEGAETHDEITVRAHRVVDRLISEHDNSDRVLVFSHGGILTHVIARLLGTDRLWFLGIATRRSSSFPSTLTAGTWTAGPVPTSTYGGSAGSMTPVTSTEATSESLAEEETEVGGLLDVVVDLHGCAVAVEAGPDGAGQALVDSV